MESRAGSVLLIISGIITLLLALLLIVFSILFFTVFSDSEENPVVAGVVLLIFGIVVLIFAFFKFKASKLMKNPETTHKGGVIALIVGFLNSDLFSIIGGILGVTSANK